MNDILIHGQHLAGPFLVALDLPEPRPRQIEFARLNLGAGFNRLRRAEFRVVDAGVRGIFAARARE